MENVYKRLSKAELNSRQQIELTTSEEQQVNTTISEFIRLFKDKHLS